MALFGRRTAVVPLGVSCQTAFQIERAQVFLADLTQEVFRAETTPFDWRIVGAAEIAAMIAENNPYPASASELEGTKRPYWRKRRCHFWHDGAGDFAAFTSKQAHLWENWTRIAGFERKVFVLSNLQNNLARVLQEVGPNRGFEYLLHPVDVVMLASQLKARFERPELHVVTRKPLFPGHERLGSMAGAFKGVRLGVHFVEPDSSQWHGDPHLWNGALAAIIGKRAAA